MTLNLSLLSAQDKNQIELDKQAAYAVWQVKHSKAEASILFTSVDKIRNEDERAYYAQAIEKYKKIMGIN